MVYNMKYCPIPFEMQTTFSFILLTPMVLGLSCISYVELIVKLLFVETCRYKSVPVDRCEGRKGTCELYLSSASWCPVIHKINITFECIDGK